MAPPPRSLARGAGSTRIGVRAGSGRLAGRSGLRRLSLVLRTLAAPAVIVILAALEVRAADCDANGVEDERDIAGGAADCNANGTPDVCELTPSRLELSPAPAFEMKETVIACALAAMDGSPGPEAVTLSTSPSAI